MSTTRLLPNPCQAWHLRGSDLEDTPHPSLCQEFLIEIYASFVYVSTERGNHGDYYDDGDSLASPTTYKPFRHEREHLIQDPTSWATISSMLSQADVPYHMQPLMISKISDAIRMIARMSRNENVKTLPMVVSVRVVLQDVGHDMASLFAPKFPLQSMTARAGEPGPPVSQSSVRALEKVKDEEEEEECAICLDQIAVRQGQAVQMPCSHTYHEDCIANWLRQSNLCPVCRFMVPVT